MPSLRHVIIHYVSIRTIDPDVCAYSDDAKIESLI